MEELKRPGKNIWEVVRANIRGLFTFLQRSRCCASVGSSEKDETSLH